jgi:hypothetical protein
VVVIEDAIVYEADVKALMVICWYQGLGAGGGASSAKAELEASVEAMNRPKMLMIRVLHELRNLMM